MILPSVSSARRMYSMWEAAGWSSHRTVMVGLTESMCEDMAQPATDSLSTTYNIDCIPTVDYF